MNNLADRSREISTGTAARILDVSHDTIMRLCEAGILEARRLPPRGHWRISYDSLVDYLYQTINRA